MFTSGCSKTARSAHRVLRGGRDASVALGRPLPDLRKHGPCLPSKGPQDLPQRARGPAWRSLLFAACIRHQDEDRTCWTRLMLVPFPGADAMPYAHPVSSNLLLYLPAAPPFARSAQSCQPPAAAVQAGGGLALMTVPALIPARQPSSPNRGITAKPAWWKPFCSLFGYLAIQTGAMWFERSCPAGGRWRRPSTELVWFSLKHDGPVGLMKGVKVMWGRAPSPSLTVGATLLQTLQRGCGACWCSHGARGC